MRPALANFYAAVTGAIRSLGRGRHNRQARRLCYSKLTGFAVCPLMLERFIYALLILLSLIALGLVLNAPLDLLDVHSVYQGF